MIQQLSILLKNQANGRTLRLDSQVEGLTYSTVAPGGFGTCTFKVPERVADRQPVPLAQLYASDLIVADMNGSSLFEGILTDVKYHSDDGDAYYMCEGTGWQILLDNPYRNMVIERSIPFEVLSVSYAPTLCRPDILFTTIGQTDPAVPTNTGFRIDSGTTQSVFNFCLGGVQVSFPLGSNLQQFYFDYNVNLTFGPTFDIEYVAYNDAGTAVASGVVIATGTSGALTDVSIALSGASKLMFYMVAHGAAATPATNSFAIFTNCRFIANRNIPTGAGFTSTQTVYGHECVVDIIAKNGQLSGDYSGIETDTTYVVPQFSYPNSDTGRAALDSITAYYNRYWAVWESKKVSWKTWSSQNAADWVVSKSVAQLDIDPSIVNSANVARVRYTDAAGISQEVDVADTRQDNVYTLAGRTKTVVVDLGTVSTSVAAPQVGAVFFPDKSYEVVGGSIRLDAQTPCYSQSRGTNLPAYLIRAGETVRIRDGVSERSVFDNTSWNRSTLFRITATDVDWEAQTVTLTCDNSQASLDQLTARIQTNLSAKYGQ